MRGHAANLIGGPGQNYAYMETLLSHASATTASSTGQPLPVTRRWPLGRVSDEADALQLIDLALADGAAERRWKRPGSMPSRAA